MIKRKHLVILFTTLLLILNIFNISNAATDYTIIIRGNDNQWIQFPSNITKSFMANWDGYYTYSGTITKITTSENVTFQVQYLEIERTEVDEIQKKSDETPEHNEFNQWLNSWAVNKINEDNWANLTNMKIELECILGEDIEHEHLVFIKVLEDSTQNIVWQGYGDGFSRISESRKKVNLESIEITTPPTKTNYEEGELFDNAGMVITAKYSDGSSKVVTNYTYTPQEALKVTDEIITIKYTENNISKEVTQEITVKEKTNEDTNDIDKAILQSIEITTPPTKTNYKEGEKFDTVGMVITAKYSDGSSKIVINYTYTPETALKVTDKIITIEYTDDNISKEATQEIKVTQTKQSSDKKEETKKEDTTTATGKIPYAGGTTAVVISMLVIAIIGTVAFIKNRKLKGI